MKPIIPVFAVAATLCVFGNQLRAQSTDDAVPVAPAKPDPAEDQPKTKQEEPQEKQSQFEKSAADFERHRADLEKRITEQNSKVVAAAAKAQKKYIDQAQNVYRRGQAPTTRSLVIRTSDSDPKDLANLEEDLTIMFHIFNKALKENFGAGFDRKAMGIDVFFNPGINPIRSLYLEGYGALFLFGVTWPLVPPPGEAEVAKDKPDSTWDEAKHELYGPKNEGKFAANPGEEFSTEKLAKLQNTLLETLKNAANIRNLKPDDTITMCVFGGAAPGNLPKMKAKRDKDAGDDDLAEQDRAKKEFAFEGAWPRGTTMTIRAKKADTDAYATGKLTLEQFREKVRITAYTGSPITGNTGFSFVTSPFGAGGGGGGFGGATGGGGGIGAW